jgi:uncharacterized membrane protein
MRAEKMSIKFPSDLWAIAICLLGFSFWSCLFFLKYNLFGFHDWDLALYSQVMQGLCHGTTHTSLFQASFLVDHAHYIAFFLTPFYALFPHPLTLMYIELFTFFAGAFIFYKIAAKNVGCLAAIALMVIYLVHPANVFMLLYEFHFESLATGFIFLMFYFWTEKKWIPFIITAFFTMLIKENMALIVIMFGVFGILFNKESKWRWGGIILGMGVLFFTVNMFILVPYFRRDLVHTSNIYWSCYTQFGSSPQEILHNLFFNPVLVLKGVLTPQNLVYFQNCTAPYLFFSIFGRGFYFGIPILAQNMLSSTPNMHTIYYHYAATFIPFVAMGALDTLVFVKKRVRSFVFVIFVTVIVTCSCIYIRPFKQMWQEKFDRWVDPLFSIREYMVEQIPKGASVVTNFIFLSHLTDHKELYAFYNVWRDVNYFTGQKPFQLPPHVQYALIDFNDTWMLYDIVVDPDFTRSRVHNFFIQNNWIEKLRYGKIVLFERREIGLR